jgi:DNA-binding beta-propeller fold protein YncE
MRRLSVILTSLALVACGGSDGGETDEVATEAAAPSARIEVQGFSTPESVLHDAAADVYLVSNIEGAPLDKDDNGFISRVTPAGTIETLRWIDGQAEGVELHAPKGMAILGDTLYVADIDCVRMFVRTTGAPAGAVCIDGATFLNDVAVDANDVLHVTDTGFRAGDEGFEPSGSQAIHRFAPDGSHAEVATGEALGHPNGITFGPRGAFVVTFGSGEIYVLETDGSRTPVLPASEGRQLDGVVFTEDGGFLFSSWGDQAVHHVDAAGTVTRVLENVEAPADIGYDATRNRVLVPLFMANTVVIQELGDRGEGMD